MGLPETPILADARKALFRPTRLLEKSPSGKNKMAWSDLVRVEYGKRYVYIYIDLSTALVIPVDKVKKGNLEQFAEQAEKMIERFA